ncbi:hypothetical protein PIB30_078785, partial [Stylosanthes scabra]|nr:hypothetical protein [Stylosanthes scabra]
MAEERASNSSTSTTDSAATEKTEPSPSKVASMPLNVSVSSWVLPQQLGVAKRVARPTLARQKRGGAGRKSIAGSKCYVGLKRKSIAGSKWGGAGRKSIA